MHAPRHKKTHGPALAANKQIEKGHRFLQQLQLEKAEKAFSAAVRFNPTDPHTHINLAFPRLLRGDFKRGFKELEWRLKIEPWASFIANLNCPPWQGEDLQGKTILLYTEQGAGDAIQSARFIPHIAALGAKVIIATQPHLKPVLETVDGVEKILVEGDHAAFDTVAPLFSLPLLLNVEPDTIPADVPYITPPTVAGEEHFNIPNDAHLKIGLVWAGNPTHLNDKNRSLGLDLFLPIVKDNPDTQFVSVQIPLLPSDEAKLTEHGITNLAPHIQDYGDTARYLDQMDLVIAVDTSVAHLAGALGKKVWMLLPCAPDWRWMLGRDDSPWYPTMRLFRQPRPGDWGSVMSDIQSALHSFADQTG